MLKLFYKLAILAIPLLILIGIYVKDDPFEVLYYHADYFNTYIPTDRDFISTELLLRQYPKEKYDSYIMGSSHSLAFLCSEWDKYINGKSFHYDASGESLFGIYTKLSFLHKNKMPIKNCLILLDSLTLAETNNSSGNSYIKHPLVSGESRLKFQFTFLSTFLSNKFFLPYIYGEIYNQPPEFSDTREFTYDRITNDLYFTFAERQMSKNVNSYYDDYKRLFYKRDSTKCYISMPVINKAQLKMLQSVKVILEEEHTNYKVVIYPSYDERYLNPIDLRQLEEIFGRFNVYDYSGLNDLTKNLTNYYDETHCRPIVGAKILKEIYSK